MRARGLAYLTFLLSATPLAAQDRPPDRRLAAASDASIRILNLAGSIRVSGWDRDSIAVMGSPPPGGGMLLMGGSERGVKVVVEANAATDLPGTHLDIRVPRGARLWVKSATAAIAIDGVTGEVEASTVTGAITVRGTPGVLVAESMEGNLDITAPARVTRLKTAGGAITVREAANEISATSVSGVIQVLGARDVSSGRLESVSGRVIFNGAVAAGGSLDLQTHDAPIEILLPARQSAVVEVSAYGGKTINRIPGLSGSPGKGKAVHYRLGNGRARIVARSLKGDVSLRQQMPRPNPAP
ncbi:MAG: DUF4097 family beta strand repeat-containing protein [Gemmatimonadota bacterium]